MNINTTLFVCHSCGRKGNAISFLSWYKKIPETEARRLLEERYGGELKSPIDDLSVEVEKIMNNGILDNVNDMKVILPSETWIEKFRMDWKNKYWCYECEPYRDNCNTVGGPECCGCSNYPDYKKYMYDRGFNPDILNKWEIGYDQYTDRITIPIRDENGRLVGFKGRQYRDNPAYPRYLILGDTPYKSVHYGFDRYRKSEYVFGLNRLLDQPDDFEGHNMYSAVVVEGELNVIAMDQCGWKALGVAGSEFSETQAELIIKYCSEIIVYFDNDQAGQKGTQKIVEMLNPHIDVRIVTNASGDAAELKTNEIEELIVNAEPALSFIIRDGL
jgi:DNA primase